MPNRVVQKSPIKLPKPRLKGLTVEDAIANRRSIRSFRDKEMSLETLSQLLFAAYGVTTHKWGIDLHAAPSAGALYPFEIYIYVRKVKGLRRGIYRYVPHDHELIPIFYGDFDREVIRACLGQDYAAGGNVTFILVAVFSRTTRKYGERGYRYIYMEAGHISQNIYLEATSLGLGTVAIGAFYDDLMNQIVGVDGSTASVIYVQPVGYPH